MKLKLNYTNTFKWKDTQFNTHSTRLNHWIEIGLRLYYKKTHFNFFELNLYFDGNPNHLVSDNGESGQYWQLTHEEKISIPTPFSGFSLSILSKKYYLVKCSFPYYSEFSLLFWVNKHSLYPSYLTFFERLRGKIN